MDVGRGEEDEDDEDERDASLDEHEVDFGEYNGVMGAPLKPYDDCMLANAAA